MYQWTLRIVKSRFFRFLVSGGLNTVITFGLYLALLKIISYQASYTIAYLTGIVISYLLNRFFVFKSHRNIQSILLFPLIYIVQYSFGMCVLWLWVERMGLSEAVGSFIAIVLSIPVTFILTRFIFVDQSNG